MSDDTLALVRRLAIAEGSLKGFIAYDELSHEGKEEFDDLLAEVVNAAYARGLGDAE